MAQRTRTKHGTGQAAQALSEQQAAAMVAWGVGASLCSELARGVLLDV